MTNPSSEAIQNELRPVLYKLYRYHLKLKNIVEKLRDKNIGRQGQLTDDEKEFLRPIICGFLDAYKPNLD